MISLPESSQFSLSFVLGKLFASPGQAWIFTTYLHQREGVKFTYFPVVPSAIHTIQGTNKLLLRQLFIEPMKEFPMISICLPEKLLHTTSETPTPSKNPITFCMGCIWIFSEAAQRQCLKYNSLTTWWLTLKILHNSTIKYKSQIQFAPLLPSHYLVKENTCCTVSVSVLNIEGSQTGRQCSKKCCFLGQ